MVWLEAVVELKLFDSSFRAQMSQYELFELVFCHGATRAAAVPRRQNGNLQNGKKAQVEW